MTLKQHEGRDPLTEKVIGCAIEVHRILGPGLLESAYQRCLELKAVDAILPVHQAQILTYMKLSGLRLGLLINFHHPRLIDGLQRFIL
ncbi:MAG: GxxExxY protein [Kiritimatiellia bacterium]|jgi:hypothetical protein|nr:GxxExxY protein [Kiritimatiellia bacterium]